MKEKKTQGFPYRDAGMGHYITILETQPKRLGAAREFSWWANSPEHPPYIAPGSPQQEGIVVTHGSHGVMIFPLLDIGADAHFYHKLFSWKPTCPTAAQLSRRRCKPPKGVDELDLLDVAFKLADCTVNADNEETQRRLLDFASVYGPLGNCQLALKSSEKYPTEMAEDILDWVVASHEILETVKAWYFQSINGWLDEANVNRIMRNASSRLESVALFPVKASRKGNRTYVPVARCLLTALWLTVWSEYSEGTQLGRCNICNAWFSARGHQKSGALPKRTCSNACNQKARYGRMKAFRV